MWVWVKCHYEDAEHTGDFRWWDSTDWHSGCQSACHHCTILMLEAKECMHPGDFLFIQQTITGAPLCAGALARG